MVSEPTVSVPTLLPGARMPAAPPPGPLMVTAPWMLPIVALDPYTCRERVPNVYTGELSVPPLAAPAPPPNVGVPFAFAPPTVTVLPAASEPFTANTPLFTLVGPV